MFDEINGEQAARCNSGVSISRPSRQWLLRGLVAVAAIAFCLSSLHRGFISGTGEFWERLAGDPATAQIGWLYYARDDWRWPVFDVRNYHYPEGSNIYLSDSLPLFALPAKVVYKATGWLPTYTGLWVALCFILQVICASALLSALGVRSALAHLAGLALFCFVPALFLRFGHMTLMAHFFLLAELAAYVRGKRERLTEREWFWVCALPVIAILTHPYMAATTLLLALAVIFDRWRDGALTLRGTAIRVGSIAAASLILIVCGGFIFRNTQEHGDYGIFSANLLSPFVPFSGTWLGQLLGTNTPSIPKLAQWEGGAYLGMGVIFLMICCVPFWRHAPAALRRHAVLVVISGSAALFAISNRIGLGTHELYVPLPHWLLSLCSAFRASGRFIWPAMYACIVAVVACIWRRYRPVTAATLLVVAALLQWIDVRPMQVSRYNASSAAPQPTIHEALWKELIQAHERIFQFPSFECGGIYDEYIENTDLFHELTINLIAARLNRPTNSAYIARFTKDCAREREQAGSDMTQPGTLYLYRSSEDIGAYMASRGQDISHCGRVDDVVVCSASVDVAALLKSRE